MKQNEAKQFLGQDAKVITNKSGDKVFLSNDGMRRIHFDINNPNPHFSPHANVEYKIGDKWVKSGPIFTYDVPQS